MRNQFCSPGLRVSAEARNSSLQVYQPGEQTMSVFSDFVDKNGPIPEHVPNIGNCWIWTKNIGSNNRGKFRVFGKQEPAARAAWLILFGKIPNGECVLHRCDNPKCVRPSHLFIGTQMDNIKDMNAKGRHANSVKKFCKRGHELTAENIYAGKATRQCKKCHSIRRKKT